MSAEQFKVILKKLAEAPVSIQTILLNWRAEPLANRSLVEFLRIRREVLPAVHIEFHTNGTLVNPRLAVDLVSAAMKDDLFYVSIDGGCPEAHEANRGPGNWRRTLDGLAMFLDARDASPDAAPRIGIYEIFYGRSAPYDPDLIQLSRRCDEWVRVPVVRANGVEDPFDSGNIPHGPCFWAGHSFCVTAWGDVHVCLLSFSRDGRLGNLLTEEVSTILTRAQQFRAQLATKGRASVPHCASCRKCVGDVE